MISSSRSVRCILVNSFSAARAEKYGSAITALQTEDCSIYALTCKKLSISPVVGALEIYGYLEEQGWLNEYKQGKTTVSYKKINTNGTTREQQICMTEYIRHQIHHPENTYNARFNDLQLRRSIEDMRAFVTSKAQTSGTT